MKKWMRRVGFMALCLGAFTLSSGVFADKPKKPVKKPNCAGLQSAVSHMCGLIREGKGSCTAAQALSDVLAKRGCKVVVCKCPVSK